MRRLVILPRQVLPRDMFHLFYKVDSYYVIYSFSASLGPIFRLSPPMLSHPLSLWVNCEVVACDVRGHIGHVSRTPSEEVGVLLEALNESCFNVAMYGLVRPVTDLNWQKFIIRLGLLDFLLELLSEGIISFLLGVVGIVTNFMVRNIDIDRLAVFLPLCLSGSGLLLIDLQGEVKAPLH